MSTLVRIEIRRREGVFDPEGDVVLASLRRLDFKVEAVQMARVIHLTLPTHDPQQALATAREMCASLLVNPIIEDHDIAIVCAARDEP